MDFFLENGIRLILLIQNLSGWLEAPMKFFSFLGSEYFFLFGLPVVYWCIDSRLGIRIGVILLFSTGLNDIFKLALQGPRPYWFSTQVRPLAAESSFGVPSGHAQNAVSIWGMAADRIRKTWAWIIAGIVIFLIGFSRMYLAVHFPHDVLAGWILGGLMLWPFLLLWDRVAAWLKQKTFAQQILIAFLVSMVFVLVGGGLAYGLRDYVVPEEWMTNAARAGDPLPAPVSMDTSLTVGGTLFGLAVGLAWMTRRGGYQASGPVWMRALALLVGSVGLFILYAGLKAIFPSGESLAAYFFRYLRYALIGFWISGGAPWLFFRIKIVRLNPSTNLI